MKIVIAGAGEVGSHLAKMLSNESNVHAADVAGMPYLVAFFKKREELRMHEPVCVGDDAYFHL